MAKKLIFTLILFGFLFGSVTNKCLADLSDQLDQALEYKKTSNFSQAEAIYQDIITNHPNTDYAVKAKIGLARMYKRTKRYSEAEALYNGVLASNVGLNDMMETQKHLAILYIATDRDQEAQAAVNKLKTDFSTRFNLPYALNGVARSYQRYGKEQDAKNIYQGITTDYPGDYHAFLAHKKLVALGAVTEINAAARTAIDQLAAKFPKIENANVILPDANEVLGDINRLVSDHPGYPYLPGIISRAAESYYVKAVQLKRKNRKSEAHKYYQKAASICDRLVNEFPNSINLFSQQAVHTYYELGKYYRQSGKYEKSTENFQTLADNYPNYDMAWYSLFTIGDNYKDLAKLGTISESKAIAETRIVYRELIERYPDCEPAKYVRHWLKRHNSKVR